MPDGCCGECNVYLDCRTDRVAMNSKELTQRVSDKICGAAGTAAWCCPAPLPREHGDLMMDDYLLRYFPFAVHCRYRAAWHPGVMFRSRLREAEGNLLDDVVIKARAAGRYPLLIVRGDGVLEECAITGLWVVQNYLGANMVPPPVMIFFHAGTRWAAIPLDTILLALKERIQSDVPFSAPGPSGSTGVPLLEENT